MYQWIVSVIGIGCLFVGPVRVRANEPVSATKNAATAIEVTPISPSANARRNLGGLPKGTDRTRSGRGIGHRVSVAASAPTSEGGATGAVAAGMCLQPAPNCQPPDNNFALTSTGTSFRVADDFRLTTSGSVQQVCFSGAYFDFTAGDCGLVGANSFEINYYTNAGGVPGTLIASFSEAGGTLTVGGPFPTGRFIAAGSPSQAAEFEFIAVHDPVPLQGNTCYWLEILNRLTGTCSWLWEGALSGNGWVLQDIGSIGYDLNDGLPEDMTFCLDQPLADNTSCRPAPPANDDCASATPIGTTGDFPFDNLTATTDGMPHLACQLQAESQIEADVWYCWTAPCTDMALVWTCGLTDLDTRIAVYDGCGTCPPGDANLLTCNDDRCGGGTGLQSFVSFQATAGQSYMIRVGVFPNTLRGAGQFHINCGTPSNAACPGSPDCCVGDPTTTQPGCVDQTCCELICACDPFCCTDFWDESCATTGLNNNGCGAQVLCENACGVCGTSNVDCCVGVQSGAGVTGCNDRTCCETVCAADPFCCEREWDSACATNGFNNSGNGAAVLCPDLCGTPSCPPGTFIFVDPADGAIDPRQPHPPGDAATLQGVSQFRLTGPIGTAPSMACWSLCETGTGGQPTNQITAFTTDGIGGYTLRLQRSITPGEITTISYTDDTGLITRGVFSSLPGDVDGDGLSSVMDVQRLLDRVNGAAPAPISFPGGADIDHSGAATPADVLRLIDLLTGADGYAPWRGVMRPNCGACCP